MPIRSKRPCTYPGCGKAAAGGRCEKHPISMRNKGYDSRRGSSASRGYDAQWRKSRLAYLKDNPLCVMCEKKGRLSVASVVDHIIPHKGDKGLMWDKLNWQALCAPCHNSDKQREEKANDREYRF